MRGALIGIACWFVSGVVVAVGLQGAVFEAQQESRLEGPVAHFTFDQNAADSVGAVRATSESSLTFTEGVKGSAYSVRPSASKGALRIEGDGLPGSSMAESFSVQFWMRTTAPDDARILVLSNKSFADNSLASQRRAGWAFMISHGTWAWNLGSGKRRLRYERDNGLHMPINDGRWHQLAMTYDNALSVVRLYYDGECKVAYNVQDSKGFDFSSDQPILVGGTAEHGAPETLPAIEEGAQSVQALVDAFDALGVGDVAPDELIRLVVEPESYYAEKRGDAAADERFAAVAEAESHLMANPYTIHQAFSFMEVAPLGKLYSLVEGQIALNREAARSYTRREQIDASDFDLDELTFWNRPLSRDEVRQSYAQHFLPSRDTEVRELPSITVGVWNIFHGGLHYSVDEHGWDARVAIAHLIEREGIDVVLMQETYSAGDFIAAELGFEFATTVDWDYLNQGSNLSVLSRYPILEVRVPEGAAFMNVAARIAVSETQDMWVMSNWYGMGSFPEVAEFHAARFSESDTTPVFFGGDFNAVPPSDGGESLAATTLTGLGFTDAFRSLQPDVAAHPGFTHRDGVRIDQLFYKGVSLDNTTTEVLRDWPAGFPSDHFLIRATFDLRAPK